MTTFRPAVSQDDGYVQKVIKYIPAEIVAGYTALAGYLSLDANMPIPGHYKTYYLILLGILVAITPVWTYFAVLDNANTGGNTRRSVFHAVIATISFLIWVYAVGNPLLKAVMCECSSTNCSNCGLYNPVLGAILLVLFTILTPLIERITLGTPLPTN